jgi:hypothetical protein
VITPPPIDGLVLGQDKEFSTGWKKWINQLYKTIFALQNLTAYSYNLSPSYPLQFPANTQILQIDAVGPIAAATILLPTYPIDAQPITIATTQAITALTLTSAYTVKNAPSGLAAGASAQFYFSKANSTWYRLV